MALTQISTQGIKDGTITGSDLATNVDLIDNQKIRFGTGNDLQIWHDGSDSNIADVGTGDLNIRGSIVNLLAGTGETFLKGVENAAVELYHDGTKKFETKSDGVLASGSLTLTGQNTTDTAGGLALGYEGSHVHQIRTYGANTSNNGRLDLVSSRSDGTNSYTITLINHAGNLSIPDNQKLAVGNGADLQIFHDGSNSKIVDSGTGSLIIQTSQFNLDNAGGTENILTATADGAVELYFDGSKKFETQNLGVTVTGGVYPAAADTYQLGGSSLRWNELNIKSVIDVSDNGKIRMGDSDDLQIYHDGTHSYIANSTNNLYVNAPNFFHLGVSNGGEKYLTATENGSVELYFNNSLRLLTTANGVTLDHNLLLDNATNAGRDVTWDPSNDQLKWNDDTKASFGDSADLLIYHASSNTSSFVTHENGSGYLFLQGDAIQLRTRSATNNDIYVSCSQGGGVHLYHNNVKKLETTSVGISSLDTLISHGEIRPASDNNHSIGRSNRRYITYFGVNSPVNTSDKNEKNTIIDSDLGLDFINKLKPISYKWNKDDGKTHYGLIAQDLEETLTSLGKTIADFGGIYKEDDSPMGLGYSELIAPLIKAVQELSTEVAALKAA